MRNIARSFGIGYTAIPLAFYCVNLVGHLRFLTVWYPFALTIALVATTVAVVWLLRRWRRRLRIAAPLALTFGGMLGLLHWFPLYMTFGSLVLWRPVQEPAFLDSLKFFGLNLLVPIIALSGATYDGSVFAILISMAAIATIGIEWRTRYAGARDQDRNGST